MQKIRLTTSPQIFLLPHVYKSFYWAGFYIEFAAQNHSGHYKIHSYFFKDFVCVALV